MLPLSIIKHVKTKGVLTIFLHTITRFWRYHGNDSLQGFLKLVGFVSNTITSCYSCADGHAFMRKQFERERQPDIRETNNNNQQLERKLINIKHELKIMANITGNFIVAITAKE